VRRARPRSDPAGLVDGFLHHRTCRRHGGARGGRRCTGTRRRPTIVATTVGELITAPWEALPGCCGHLQVLARPRGALHSPIPLGAAQRRRAGRLLPEAARSGVGPPVHPAADMPSAPRRRDLVRRSAGFQARRADRASRAHRADSPRADPATPPDPSSSSSTTPCGMISQAATTRRTGPTRCRSWPHSLGRSSTRWGAIEPTGGRSLPSSGTWRARSRGRGPHGSRAHLGPIPWSRSGLTWPGRRQLRQADRQPQRRAQATRRIRPMTVTSELRGRAAEAHPEKI
jgi:hypothetical protein